MSTKICVVRIAALNSILYAAVNAHAANVTGNTYNPAMSVILDGRYVSTSRDPANYHVSGMPLGGEAEGAERGFALQEAELALSANIDDWFYGGLTTAMHQHDGETAVEVEEAFIETTSLGSGFTVKAGKFFSGFGYLNAQHPHSWDFVNTALVYAALMGNQIGDSGVQVRWVAPTDLFLELGAEALRGASYPGSGYEKNGAGARTLFVRVGGDIGASNSWRVGLSRYATDAVERGADSGFAFDGSVNVTGIDVVWKWAPQGNTTQQNLKVQFEALRRTEDGSVTDVAGSTSADYDGTQSGWYLQAAYQFIPQWRVAARFDRLKADNNVSDTTLGDAAGLNNESHDPSRVTLGVDYSHSEYSRIRAQYSIDKSYPKTDNQFMVQYLMSIGAHGAHQF